MAQSENEGSAPATLQTVERALSFLETVAASEEPLTIRDVASLLGVNITTCYHLFNTLFARGYIDRNPDMTLRVGFQAAVVYDGYQHGSTTRQLMNELVVALARKTAETAWISTLVDDSVVLTGFEDGLQPVRATGLRVGLSGNEHKRASGRAVLAFADMALRDRILTRSMSDLKPAERKAVRAALDEELEVVRQRGWAMDDEVYQPGIVGIAAPYFSSDGDVLGAVGIWSPASRAHDILDSLVEAVCAAANDATSRFGRTRD